VAFDRLEAIIKRPAQNVNHDAPFQFFVEAANILDEYEPKHAEAFLKIFDLILQK
jgi:hypothetical protein